MAEASEIRQHNEIRTRMASWQAEMLARSHEILALSEALLQQGTPTTFLGKQNYPPPPKQDD
jgi:hypothetical protein